MITITWTSGSQVFAAGCGTDAVLRMFRGGVVLAGETQVFAASRRTDAVLPNVRRRSG